MKKLLAIISILAATNFLFACSSISGPFKDEPDQQTLEGILTRQSDSDEDKYKGTHLLTTTDEVVPLNSTSINLSSNQYLGNMVTVIGVLDSEEGVINVTGISVIEVLSDNDNSGELMEYRNTDLGFRLNYYNNWEIKESSDGVSFVTYFEDGYNDEIKIEQFPFSYSSSDTNNSEMAPLFAYFEQYHPSVPDLEDKRRQIGPDQIPSIELTENGTITHYLYRNGLIYKLRFIPAKSENAEENERIYREMIADFKFLGFTVSDDGEEPEETDEPRTQDLPEIDMELSFFESKPFEFKGAYPENWYYSGASSSAKDVLWHYGFSEESVTPENELVTLDIMATPMPSGSKLQIDDKEVVSKVSGDLAEIFIEVDSKVYRISGEKNYHDLMLNMAVNIESTTVTP